MTGFGLEKGVKAVKKKKVLGFILAKVNIGQTVGGMRHVTNTNLKPLFARIVF